MLNFECLDPKRLWVACCGIFALWALSLGVAWAQSTPAKIVMVLPREEQNIETGFRDYLSRRNVAVTIDVIRFSGKSEDGPALVQQIRQAAPDLIYTWGTTTTLAVAGTFDAESPQNFVRDIPVVFTEVTDPLGSHLLQQLDPPGRNLTGVSHVAPLQVQLNAMKAYRPFHRVGYITNPKESNTALVLKSMEGLADQMGFEIVNEVVPLDEQGRPDAQALPAMIQRLAQKKVDFLYIGPSTFLAFTHRDLVTQSALDARLPTFCATESIVRKAKCMFGLFSNGSNIGRFAAYKAAQILVDKVPVAKVRAETLQRFSLLINMPVVMDLALYPPLGLLNVAEVIESSP
jgi:putative tryptophan/tyrosine transport system substrate-binding protein